MQWPSKHRRPRRCLRRAAWASWRLGQFDAKDGIHEQRSVETKASGNGGTEAGDAEVKRVHCCKPCAGAHNQAHRVSIHGSHAATEALAHEEQPETKAEAQVSRSDDLEIQGTKARHLGVIAEQTYPKIGLQRDNQSDRSANNGRCNRAGPCDPASAVV